MRSDLPSYESRPETTHHDHNGGSVPLKELGEGGYGLDEIQGGLLRGSQEDQGPN